MNPITWLVIANRKSAQFFLVETLQSLDLMKSLSLDLYSEETQDFSDRPGRGHERFGPGRHAIDRKTSPKEKEKLVFARHVADFLSQSYQQGEFTRLYLAAPPDFLGHLREALDKNTSKVIEKTIDKDMIHQKPEDVLQHILEQ